MSLRKHVKAKSSKSSWEPEWLKKIHAPAWVVLILAIIFILRVPSFFEPYYYGDEMIYLNLGEAVNRGMVLYRDIHDNKPPLLYLTAAVAGNVFWFRAILTGWMMITTLMFWRLAIALFPKKDKIVAASTVTFAILTTIPLLEGQIANAEVFMIGPTITAFYVLLTKKHSAKNLLFAGVLLSISTLFKMPALFDIGAIVFLWLITLKRRRGEVGHFARRSFLLFIGFAGPILFSFVWYYLRGALSEYIASAFLQNIGYVSSWRPDSVAAPFLVKNAPLLIRGGVLATGLSLLYFFKKRLSYQFVFITGWLLFSLFAATLSERPYPHYLVQLAPATSLLVGILIAAQSREQSLSLIPISLVFFAIVQFRFWYYPTASYYQRFISYATGQTTKESYFNSFDKNTVRNYQISNYIRSSSDIGDFVFVWGDSPAIYALSKRFPPIKYIATYHINDFSSQEKTIEDLAKNSPKLVVVLPEADSFPMLDRFLRNGYLLIDEVGGAKIWKAVSFSRGSLIK